MNPVGRTFPRDLGVAVAAIGLSGLAYAWTLWFEEVPAALAQSGMQPATFPRLVLGLIVVIALIVGVQGVRRARVAPEVPRAYPPTVVFVTLALCLAAVALGPILGFAAAMTMVCFVMPLLWGERRWAAMAAFAILFPAAVYGLFSGVFSIAFPAGPFGRWFG